MIPAKTGNRIFNIRVLNDELPAIFVSSTMTFEVGCQNNFPINQIFKINQKIWFFWQFDLFLGAKAPLGLATFIHSLRDQKVWKMQNLARFEHKMIYIDFLQSSMELCEVKSDLPSLGWSPINLKMVTLHKEVCYRLGIWHLDLTYKIRTRWQLPGRNGHVPYLGWSTINLKMVTYQKEVYYRLGILLFDNHDPKIFQIGYSTLLTCSDMPIL